MKLITAYSNFLSRSARYTVHCILHLFCYVCYESVHQPPHGLSLLLNTLPDRVSHKNDYIQHLLNWTRRIYIAYTFIAERKLEYLYIVTVGIWGWSSLSQVIYLTCWVTPWQQSSYQWKKTPDWAYSSLHHSLCRQSDFVWMWLVQWLAAILCVCVYDCCLLTCSFSMTLSCLWPLSISCTH